MTRGAPARADAAPGTEADADLWSRVVRAWRALRGWRRIHFTSGGLAFTGGTFAVGFAAMNTGNNHLYLLLGSMLGFVAVSGWLSEQAIRDVRIDRRFPRPVTVGQELRLEYLVTNAKRRLPSLAVEIAEEGLPSRAFVPHVAPRGTAESHSFNSFVRRGIYPLDTVTLSTSFPFGLFLKERDVHLPGEVVVWPRHDRPVRDPAGGAGRRRHTGVAAAGASAVRGDYRSLRAYRVGDDPRDIHWRSSARLMDPVIREYERDGSEACWICLDTRGDEGEAAEVAAEIAASLAAKLCAQQRPFALATPGHVVSPGEGTGHLERVLDVLARVDFSPTAPAPSPPAGADATVLVTLGSDPGFADVFRVPRDARLNHSPDDDR